MSASNPSRVKSLSLSSSAFVAPSGITIVEFGPCRAMNVAGSGVVLSHNDFNSDQILP